MSHHALMYHQGMWAEANWPIGEVADITVDRNLDGTITVVKNGARYFPQNVNVYQQLGDEARVELEFMRDVVILVVLKRVVHHSNEVLSVRVVNVTSNPDGGPDDLDDEPEIACASCGKHVPVKFAGYRDHDYRRVGWWCGDCSGGIGALLTSAANWARRVAEVSATIRLDTEEWDKIFRYFPRVDS